MSDAKTWAAGLVGQTVGGRYVLEKVLGVGGMGAVFQATHKGLQKPVALKILVPELVGEEEVVKRFRQEARAAATVGGVGVVAVQDLDDDPVLGAFLVMEHLRGDALNTRLKAGVPSFADTARWTSETLETLSRVHAQNIVHRDLKPANLFLTLDDRGVERLKILDFGIARVIRSKPGTLLTMAGTVLGTPRYMAPEQAAGLPDVDHRADLYAMGAILYACLGGKAPYFEYPPAAVAGLVTLRDPKPLREVRPGLPEPLYALVDRALKKDRNERFPDATTMRQAAAEAFATVLGSPGDTGSVTGELPTAVRASVPSGFGSSIAGAATAPRVSFATPPPALSTPPPEPTRPSQPATRPSLSAPTPAPWIGQTALGTMPGLPPPAAMGGGYGLAPYPPVAPPPARSWVKIIVGGVITLTLVGFGALVAIGVWVSDTKQTSKESSLTAGAGSGGVPAAPTGTVAPTGTPAAAVNPLRERLNAAAALQASGQTEALDAALEGILRDARAPGVDPVVGPDVYYDARLLQGMSISERIRATGLSSGLRPNALPGILALQRTGREALEDAIAKGKEESKACANTYLGRLLGGMAAVALQYPPGHGLEPPDEYGRLSLVAYRVAMQYPANVAANATCLAEAQTAISMSAR